MKKINFYFEHWTDNNFPIPNGETNESFILDNTDKNYVWKVHESKYETSFNEILQNFRRTSDREFINFQHKDIIVTISNEIKTDAKNYYVVMPKTHLFYLDKYLPTYDIKLKEGHTILFVSPHEIGEYTEFFDWINNNEYKDNIIIVSIAKNLNEYVKCKTIFFPFLLFDMGKDFKFKGEKEEWSVCTREQYETTPKEKDFVSWNRNVRRLHRLLFYEFCKEEQLLNNYVSFIDFPDRDLYVNMLANPEFTSLKKYIKNYSEYGGERLDIDLKGIPNNEVQNKLTNRFNVPDVYKKSHFSIVTETNYFENFEVITEKILRPIANHHPFILIGSKNSYEILKEFGYKIPNIINYEYIDNAPNPILRIGRTFIEIKKLLSYLEVNKKLPNLDLDILSHNQNLLLNTNREETFYNLFEKIYNI
jgi:hypothetical protein